MLPPWAMITPSRAALGHRRPRAVTECDLFLMLTTEALGEPAHAAEQQLAVALDQRRPAGDLGH